MRLPRRYAVMVLTLVLSACAGGISVLRTEEPGRFAPEEYQRSDARAPVPVMVSGSAFGLDERALSNAVVAAMQGAEWGYHAQLIPAYTIDTSRIYWYAMVFNAPADANVTSACSRPLEPAATAHAPLSGSSARAAPVRLDAVLCRYDTVALAVRATAADLVGVRDPRFRELVRSAVRELTRPGEPRFDRPEDSGGGDDRGGQT
jgi:hypothetical protein